MARAATTADVFNAIAEPRRREIIDMLAGGEARAVGEMVQTLRMSQPAVSKHLGVLRKVGIVSVTKQGPLRLYRLEAKQLKPSMTGYRNTSSFGLITSTASRRLPSAKPRAGWHPPARRPKTKIRRPSYP